MLPRFVKDNRGFTLVEMLVVTAVFIVVVIISSDAFNKILSSSRKLTQSEESNIEGVVGLEMLRHDLAQSGYGLPWAPVDFEGDITDSIQILPKYDETDLALHKNFNDGDPSPLGYISVPRAIVAGNNIAAAAGTYNLLAGTDYLAIKAASVGRATASKRFTHVSYSSSGGTPQAREPRRWPAASDNIPNGSGVIVINRERDTSGKNYIAKLIYDPAATASTNYFYQTYPSAGSALPVEVSPQRTQDLYIVYGIDDDDLRMPFNRVNYFVARPNDTNKVPQMCAPNTGNLYKTTVNHSDGHLNYLPILDCVADMQIVLGWNFSDTTAVVDTYSNADGSVVSGIGATGNVQGALANAATLRDRLKVIKVYVLAQDGRKDTSYTSPSPIVVGNKDSGEESLTKSYNIAAAGWSNYRWKVYRIVVSPKNLIGS